MKAFITSLALAGVSAVEVGSTVKTITMSDPATETPIAQSGADLGLNVSWMTQKTETDTETTTMLMMGFTTGMGANLISNDQYVLAYAQFPDPDASGKYSGFTCTVKFDTEDLYVEGDDIWVQNYYGTTSLMVGKATAGTFKTINQAEMVSPGPWTMAGDPTSSDTLWEQSYAQEVMPNTSITCGAGRLYGDIPDSVFTGQTAVTTFKWGDIAGWADIKTGNEYEVQTGYKIYASDTATTPTKEKDGATFKMTVSDTAYGLTASIATVATILLASF